MRYIVQGTVHAPLAPTGTLFIDKWAGSSTGPIQRATRNVAILVVGGLTTVTPAGTGETVRLDKFAPSRVERVLPKPQQRPDFTVVDPKQLTQPERVDLAKIDPPSSRVVRTQARPFFSQARTITFYELAPIEWTQDFSSVVLPKRPRFTDRTTIDPRILTGVETATVDKWDPSPGRAMRPAKRLPNFPQSELQTLSTVETITLEKWNQSRRYAFRPAVTFRQERPAFMFTPAPVENVSLDKWDPREGRVLRAPRLYRYPDPVIQLATFPEDVQLDKWIPSALERSRAPRPLTAYPGSVLQLATFTETSTLDKWIPSQLERSRPREPLKSYPGSVLQIFSFGETLTLDKWIPSQLERSRPPKPLTAYPGSVLQIAIFGETIGLEKWLGSGVPAHRARIGIRGSLILVEVAPETLTLDKWTGTRPRVPERIRLVRGHTHLGRNETAESVSIDRWLESGRRPHLFVRVLRPVIIEYPAPVAGSPPENVTPDKWIFDYRVTRPAPRLFTYPPPFMVLTDEIAIVPAEPAAGLDLQVIRDLRQTSTTPDVIRYGSQTSGSQTKRDAIAVAMQNRFRRTT